MALVLGYASSLPVVKMGRIAGQFSKPRSKPTETRGGVTLPSYRGDAVNGIDFTQESRTPDPSRLLRVYHASLAVLNVVRAFSSGAQPDLRESHLRNHEFVSVSPFGKHYEPLWQEIDAALEFLRSLGVVAQDQNELFTSHEALLLDYESALTRLAGEGELYALSGHMIWIGERTRQLDGAHIEFASRVQNPVGVKLSASTTPDDVLALVDKLDPARDPGRLTFIVRMGSERVRDCLPALVDKVNASGAQIVWVCDPMHGNTIEAPGGYKTRRFDQIFDEIKGFFEVHHELGTHAGGVHLELTSEEVTECLGGSDEVIEHDLPKRYESTCDPRLNRSQALDLAFAVAELYRQRR
jgi:3-deoxy-7-phosphoheptulonate synthase